MEQSVPAALSSAAAARAGPSRTAPRLQQQQQARKQQHDTQGMICIGMQQLLPLGITWTGMQQALA